MTEEQQNSERAPRTRSTRRRTSAVQASLDASTSPAEAAAVAEELLTKLNEADEGNRALALTLEGNDASICAIQLLVATRRSAEDRGVTLKPDRSAKAILGRLDTPMQFGSAG